MNISKGAELTASIHHIEKFSESFVPIYNSEVPLKSQRREKTKDNCKVFCFTRKLKKVKFRLESFRFDAIVFSTLSALARYKL